MSKDEANLRRVEGTREMHSISVHGRETDNLWSRLCVRLVRFPDALSTGDVYPLQRGSSLDSLSPLLLPHDSHFLLLSVSLSLFLSCSFSALRRFSRSAFFSLFKWRWRTLRNSKDIWSLQEYLRPVSRVLLHIYRVAISTFIFDCQCKCFLLG